MDKPKLELPMGKMLNYNEVIDYIEDKYKIKTRDYVGTFTDKGPTDKPYLDFWHWLLDFDGEINNPCRGHIPSPKHWDISNPVDGELEPDKPDDWVIEILTYIHDEFKEYYEDNHLEVWIEW